MDSQYDVRAIMERMQYDADFRLHAAIVLEQIVNANHESLPTLAGLATYARTEIRRLMAESNVSGT